jgi:hypothetical protein
MKQKIFQLILLAALTALSASCAAKAVSGASNENGSSSQSGVVEDKAGLIAALEAAGAKVESGDPIEQPFFSVPGEILKVNGADIEVFEYASAEAMGTEASQVSQDGSSIGTSMASWMDAPHFFRTGRLLVLYVGSDASILNFLKGALGEQFAGR